MAANNKTVPADALLERTMTIGETDDFDKSLEAIQTAVELIGEEDFGLSLLLQPHADKLVEIKEAINERYDQLKEKLAGAE